MNIDDVILFITSFISLFGFVRNVWVYRKREKVLLRAGYFVYGILPSYNTMMLKFWIWDINKFIK